MDRTDNYFNGNYVRQKFNHMSEEQMGLNQVCFSIEDKIPVLILDTVIKAVCEEAGLHGSSTSWGDKKILEIDGRGYAVSVLHEDKSTLKIEIDRVYKSESITGKKLEEEVDGLGQFRKIKVYSVPSFQYPKLVLEVGCNVAKVAYECLFSFVSERLKRLTIGGTESLYKKLRQLASNYIPHMWPYVIVKDRLFYILDHTAQKTALKMLANGTQHQIMSPLQMWGNFSEQMIPYDLTFSKESFKTKKGLPSFFGDAKYVTTGLMCTESVIYGTDCIIPQPLVKEGEVQCGVGYPKSFESKLNDKFFMARPQFEKIIHSHVKKFISLREKLEKHDFSVLNFLKAFIAAINFNPKFFGCEVDREVFIREYKRRAGKVF